MIYVYLDCNKTQDYVFSSRRLRGIRNGSLAIQRCDQCVGDLPPTMAGETIRALGAVVIAKFPDRQSVDRFLREARDIYHRYGIGFASACVERSAPADFYQDVLAPLLKEVRAKKDCPQDSLLGPPSTILAATCDTSGRGAAQGLVQLGPRGNPPQRANATEQTKWNMPVFDCDAENLVWGWPRAQQPIRIPATAEGVVAWNSSEEIMGKEVPGTSEQRLLGMVFADVNGLGSLLPHIAHDETKFKAFASVQSTGRGPTTALRECLSECLKQALQDELATPVNRRLRRESQVDAVPFRLLFLGGDDLCFAVAGAYALPLTKRFIEHFEACSPEILKPLRADTPNLPPYLTLSAGVVIAPYNYPILSFRRLGQGLEARTKQMGRAWANINGEDYPPNLVDFYLVKNDVSGTLEDVRRSAYTPYEVDIKTALFGGPYMVSRGENGQPHRASERFLPLENLLESAKELAAIRAGGKLKSLPLLLNRQEAQGFYREWWDHLGEYTPQWFDTCQRLGLPTSRDELPIRGYPHLNTPVLDALQLVPFATLRKRWER